MGSEHLGKAKGRMVSIPSFKIVEDGKDGYEKTIASFDGYDEVYKWASLKRNAWFKGTMMGWADFIILCDEVPLKYNKTTGKLYSLGWSEVKGRKKE